MFLTICWQRANKYFERIPKSRKAWKKINDYVNLVSTLVGIAEDYTIVKLNELVIGGYNVIFKLLVLLSFLRSYGALRWLLRGLKGSG